MDYFVMDQDGRSETGRRVDLKNPAFYGQEPFVAWMDLAEKDKLPDFLWSGRVKPVFCVSEAMKDILDHYHCLLKTTPVFLTDRAHRSQRVYWLIELREEDCLRQDPYVLREEQEFCSIPDKSVSFFKARNVRIWYPIVSLELAENLLRRRMYGLLFYPVEQCRKEG